MQEMIVCEALDFVCQKMQSPILLKLIESSLYCWVLADSVSLLHGNSSDRRIREFNKIGYNSIDAIDGMAKAMTISCRQLIGMDKQEFELVFYFIRDDVMQALSLIDWPGQFEKLEQLQLLEV